MATGLVTCSQAMNNVVDTISDTKAEELANSILAQLTLEDKIRLCHGSGTFTVGAIPRVGITKEFKMSDNSSTVRPDVERLSWKNGNETATAFPSLSALGATWDRDLVYQFGDALGKEARARGMDMQLGPGVNIHRTPVCGRNWEYFGEDPAHAAKLVVPYVKAVQKNGVATTVKHFVANNQELARHSCSSNPDERTLREIYLPAFKAAICEGGSLAIMNGYNKFRGEKASHSDYLNNKILKGEWGFKGFVVSDWGGLTDTLGGALGGTDVEMCMGANIRHFKQPLLDAVKNGSVPEEILDDKVKRVLYVMAKTQFIGDDGTREKGALETPEHTELARVVAEQAITLLKNDKNVLPLNRDAIKTLLVIGDNAIRKHCPGGGSATANPKYEISPLEGIKKLVGNEVDVQFRNVKDGDDNLAQIPDVWIKTLDPNSKRVGLGQPAFKAEYFNNTNLSGAPVHVRYEKAIHIKGGKASFPEGIRKDNISVRWTAKISPVQSGNYTFGATVDDGVRIFIDNQPIAKQWRAGGQRLVKGNSIYLDNAKEYDLRVEYLEYAGAAVCEFGMIEEAVYDFSQLAAEAAQADAVIYFTGNQHYGWKKNVETESVDRKSMKLLKCDNQAIADVLKAKPETVIVNLSGVGVEMPWVDQAATLVQYYFSGQEGGNAIANVLFGKVNPSGKLTFTMPKKLSDSPAHALNDYNDKAVEYKEGVFVGYRWFDAKKIEPLFPFGHGLSYTTFKVGKPQLSKSSIKEGAPVTVKVNVTNTGKTAGAEVVQLYIVAPKSDVERPVRELKNFGKVFLQPGETKTVTMQVNWQDLAYWETLSSDWKVIPGAYQIEIGTSSRDIKHRATLSAGETTITEVSDQEAMDLANEILAKLTLEEKISLTHGSGTFTLTNIPRVGIEHEFTMSDNSSTVATDIQRNSWKGTPVGEKQTATAFPSMSALGATWDRELAYLFADALGREGRFRGKDMQLGPGVNIHRTPLCGRNWEYFGEDPAHSAKMVVPYVKALQHNNVAATVKHFVGNNSEWGRFGVDVDLDERALREIYLPAFEAAVKEGGALAIMSGFNKIRGELCSHNDYLNNQILKKEWGFKGLVVTDWGGMRETIPGALGGTDVEMGMGANIRLFKKPLLDAVKNGTVPESVVDDKARRVLYVMAKTKFIGNHSDREQGRYETPGHAAVARKVAEEAVTLLKNEDQILPLNPDKIKTVLVLGDNAIHKHCSGGGSARARPKYEISPLEGIKNLLGDGVEVKFRNVQGAADQITQLPETWIRTLDPTANRTGLGQPAYKVEYFNNTKLKGAPVHTAYDKNINFNKDKQPNPEGVRSENMSIRWTATISPDQSGDYVFGAAMDDGARIFVNNKVVAENWKAGGRRIVKGAIYLDKNKEYELRVEYLEFAGAAVCEFGMIKDAVRDFSALAAEAVKADAVIYFTGNNHIYVTPVIESEGCDRKSMNLHKHDDQAISTVLKTRPDMVIVNLSGTAVSMPWIDEAKALVQYYFSGQEGGNAIANVLFGKVNPSGKLTFTMPKKLSDSPAHALDDYNGTHMKYKEGVFVGYRLFDAKNIEPLFPFGHGLSYTTFAIGKPELSSSRMEKDGRITVRVAVKNTGNVAGAEVVQLYVAAPKSDIERPVRELKDFGKVFLQPGETKTVEMQLTWRALAYWDITKKDWNVEPGKYHIEIGNSSRNITQTLPLNY